MSTSPCPQIVFPSSCLHLVSLSAPWSSLGAGTEPLPWSHGTESYICYVFAGSPGDWERRGGVQGIIVMPKEQPPGCQHTQEMPLPGSADCSFPVLQQLFGKASLCLLYLDLHGRAPIPFLPHLLALLTGTLGLEFSWGRRAWLAVRAPGDSSPWQHVVCRRKHLDVASMGTQQPFHELHTTWGTLAVSPSSHRSRGSKAPSRGG